MTIYTVTCGRQPSPVSTVVPVSVAAVALSLGPGASCSRPVVSSEAARPASLQGAAAEGAASWQGAAAEGAACS